MEAGANEAGTVMYLRGTSHDGSHPLYYYASSNGGDNGEIHLMMGGVAHICSQCDNSEEGGVLEMTSFLGMAWDRYSMRMGDSFEDPLKLVYGSFEENAEVYLNGSMMWNLQQSNDCYFDVTYQMENPMFVDYPTAPDTFPKAGSFRVSVANGRDYDVEISGGSVILNNNIVYDANAVTEILDECGLLPR